MGDMQFNGTPEEWEELVNKNKMSNNKEQKQTPTVEELQEKFGIGKTTNPKAYFLRQNGWTDYYHHDNWVKEEWFNQGLNVAVMGLSLDAAYERVYNEIEGGNK